MQTLTLAGHETTASTVSYILWELFKNWEYQTKMRARPCAAYCTRGDIRFTFDGLGPIVLSNNAIKESPRYHAILPVIQRYTG
ncbi:hypothetical protein C8Q80DRAFT_50020 [Daedaleopsis nitida]|nr:hypothetical protein C8Q80DRAFT_50020 [Daedaleopsis nitida]